MILESDANGTKYENMYKFFARVALHTKRCEELINVLILHLISALVDLENRRLKNDRGSSFRFSDSGKVKITVIFFFSRVRYLKFSLIIFD